ncbi:MAG TPA: family 16 glycosylhydrolase [Polyangiaceae bacterium]|nr:family 16 glycosylhydrolase [Polyangiaceae bacterium]
MKHSLLSVMVWVGVAGCGSSATAPESSGGASTGASAGGRFSGAGADGTAHAGASIGGALPVASAGSSTGTASSAGAHSAGAGTGGAAGGVSNAGASSAGTHSAGTSNGGTSSAGASTGGAVGSGGSDAIVTPTGYKLVWHDEFDVDGAPDPAVYSFEKGFQRNEEAQWYQSANATVQGGLLVIEARKETVQNPNYTGSGDWKTTRKTAEYTSSSLSTSGHQSFQYGHFEMRARIPTDAGMWPAWWTLGVSGEWPSNGEIDIMEFYQSKLLANVACGTSTRWQAKWDSATKSLSSLGASWTSQFHVWTMDWDDQNIVLSVDGTQLNTSALSSMLNSDGKSPFKQKAYMIVNLAIGGQNGGDPSKTSFPKRYEIDYLRVFQKQ